MLKLKLKRKKKEKKSKKNQELFTEEELAAYKQREQRERQEAAAASAAVAALAPPAAASTSVAAARPSAAAPAAAAAAAAAASASTSAAAGAAVTADDTDEWRKFAALTSGIDTVLKKTQGNLDRLKESSFYQREPTKCEREEQQREQARQQAEAAAAAAAEKRRAAEAAAAEEQARKDADPTVELTESEDESEEADDIFDTTYLDDLASRGVELYVPESPTAEFDAGPDPFDTDYAEKVIKGPEVSKRGKKLVHIGAAVEVLTGRVDKVAATSAVRRPRRGIQNLLLQSFDEGAAGGTDASGDGSAKKPETPVRSLLDDIPDDIPCGPIDLSGSLHLQFIKQEAEKKKEQKEQEDEHTQEKPSTGALVKDAVSEFDILASANEVEDEFDEFAELAAESLTAHKDVQVLKNIVPVISAVAETTEVSGDWASFQGQQTDSKKPKPPARPPPPKAIAQAAIFAAAVIDPSEEFPTPDDEDPFDTTFAERVLPLEDDFDFDPRADEPATAAKPEPINLLDEHIGDTTQLANPIVVQQSVDVEPEDIDPFDTSAIAAIVAPKATEIQFLEKELLSDTATIHHSLSDPDFYPRAVDTVEETASPPPSTADLNRRKSSLSLNIAPNTFPLKTVGFASDFLAVSAAANAAGKIQKPLTPYYAEQLVEEKEPEDPFDTSFVPARKPSKVELNLLERDLLAGGSLNLSISDPDFDPRAVTPVAPRAVEGKADLLAVSEEHNIKVLTPAQNERRSLTSEYSLDSYVDPFDTSAVNKTILPGRAELKIIEDELLPQTVADPSARVTVLDSCSDSQELGLGGKVLTPQIPFDVEQELEEIDPFDTSIANNLAPGQVEIKLLESELIHQ